MSAHAVARRAGARARRLSPREAAECALTFAAHRAAQLGLAFDVAARAYMAGYREART